LAAAVFVALFTSACWRVGAIDGPSAGSGAGRTTDDVHADKSAISLPVLPGFPPLTEPVVAYYDTTAHRLRLGIDAVSTGWNFRDLDGAGVAGGAGRVADDVGHFVSIAGAFPNLEPQIDGFYLDATNGRLRHFRSAGLSTTLTFEDLDGPGVPGGAGRTGDPSGVYNSAVNGIGLHDFYTSSTSVKPAQQRLRHTWFDGSWHFEDVDGPGATSTGATSDNVGAFVSAASSGSGLHVFYADSTTGRLRYAHLDSGVWTTQDLDGPGVGGGAGRTGNSVGTYNAAVATGDGKLHDYYYDAAAHRLRHAWFDGSWHFENLDGPGVAGAGGRTGNNVGSSTATVAGDATTLDVFYADETAHTLRHAHFDGTIWKFEIADGAGSASTGGTTTDSVGQDNAAAYNAPGIQLHFFTGDTNNGDLRHGCNTAFGAPAPALCN
jgi:YD repeat-containing protein